MNRELTRVNERHRQLIDLAARGKGNKEIATALGMAENTVYMLLQSEIIKHEVAKTSQRIRAATLESSRGNDILANEQFRNIVVPKAVETANRLLDSATENNQVKIVNKLLDLAYGRASVKDLETAAPVVMNANNMQFLIQVLSEERE